MNGRCRFVPQWLFTVSLIALILLSPCMALGATICVPADQPTIQAGIDEAVNGDTVLVADGIYTGDGNKNIDFKGKAITVQSKSGASNCIVDGQISDNENNGSGLYFRSGESKTSVLSGFTITNFSQGIACLAASATITGCTVTGNGGTGIECAGSSSSVTIINCTVSGNFGTGIVYDAFSSSAIITNCTVTGNGGEGIACFSPAASATITGCTVTGNSGGILCSGSANITDCTVTGNDGTGIFASSTSAVTITGCTVSENSWMGIKCVSSSVTITDCAVSDNSHTGIECLATSYAIITDCTVNGNSSTGIASTSSSITITTCTVGGNGGTGIDFWSSSSTATITGCTVSGNSGTGIQCDYYASSLTITDCTVSENNNAGIQCHASLLNIENSLIHGNSATGSVGGIIFDSYSEPTPTNCLITNCTISGNTANYTGGVSIEHGSAVIKNTIIWGNTPDINYINDNVIVTYSDVAGYAGTGDGNIDENPLFVGNSNSRLLLGSPCIDTGTSSGAPNTDIEGNSRPKVTAMIWVPMSLRLWHL